MKKQKLVLNRETIRPLRNGDLAEVVGGSGTVNACEPATRNGCNATTSRRGWASTPAMCGGSFTCNVGPSGSVGSGGGD